MTDYKQDRHVLGQSMFPTQKWNMPDPTVDLTHQHVTH